MKTMVVAVGILAGVFAMTTQANAVDVPSSPDGWVAMPAAENGVVGYHTNADKNLSLLVLVRPIASHGETPMQWADAETDLLRNKQATILSSPETVDFKNRAFAKLVSASNVGGVDVVLEQYFTEDTPSGSLIEVAVMGPEAFFEAERERIRSFLDGF